MCVENFVCMIFVRKYLQGVCRNLRAYDLRWSTASWCGDLEVSTRVAPDVLQTEIRQEVDLDRERATEELPLIGEEGRPQNVVEVIFEKSVIDTEKSKRLKAILNQK